MSKEIEERWKSLCEQASVEQDPQRLLSLIQEINELLKSNDRGPKQPPERPGAQAKVTVAGLNLLQAAQSELVLDVTGVER